MAAAAASKKAEQRSAIDATASDNKSESSTDKGSVKNKTSGTNTPPHTPRRHTNVYEKSGFVLL